MEPLARVEPPVGEAGTAGASPAGSAPCPRCGWPLPTGPTPARRCGRCFLDFTLPPPPPVHSRWRGGATTFGPVGRLLCTSVVLGPPAFLYWAEGPAGLLWCVSWLVLGVPLLLRAVWARGRVS